MEKARYEMKILLKCRTSFTRKVLSNHRAAGTSPSYRAELRVTAARLLQHLGLADRVSTTELTDHERDELLKMVCRCSWPDEQTELVIGVLSFLAAVILPGQPRDEREKDQLAAATLAALAHMAAMKAGRFFPSAERPRKWSTWWPQKIAPKTSAWRRSSPARSRSASSSGSPISKTAFACC